ncbi:MAG: formylmethanofuran dehydrogenase [Hadesarchaea archaeon]|nr:MAG: formylmethanofuran dehydrogenase [Hadesarchaea archaeon]
MLSRTRELVEEAKRFHGHLCPFLSLGVRASEIAMKRLGVKRAGEGETVGERLLALVECNSCFTDGVQVATGCTLGNNCLIYLDLGKTAVTLVKRGEWKGIRVCVDPEYLRVKHFSREALELFEKVVSRREGTEEEARKLGELWEEIGYKMAELPEEEFKIEEVGVKELELAPIFGSVRFEECGELVMKTRIKKREGKNLCLGCEGRCNAVMGKGIVVGMEVPLRRGS